jgi:ABC-type nitrate/sulfonate/bicarbonate transport system permease component
MHGVSKKASVALNSAISRFPEYKGLLFGLGILALWELFGRTKLIDSFVIPLPSVFLSTFGELVLDGSLFVHIAASLKRVMIGYFIGAVVGVSLGAILGLWKWAAELIVPVVEALRPIPPIAWVPIAILWFGIGDTPAFFIVFLGAVFPIFTNTFVGIRNVDISYVNSARCLGADRWLLVTRVLIPAAIPMVMTGLRVGLGFAWMCVVAAELIAARSGLGYMIEWYRQLLRTDVVLVGMASIGIAGLLTNYLMLKLENYMLPWQRDFAEVK